MVENYNKLLKFKQLSAEKLTLPTISKLTKQLIKFNMGKKRKKKVFIKNMRVCIQMGRASDWPSLGTLWRCRDLELHLAQIRMLVWPVATSKRDREKAETGRIWGVAVIPEVVTLGSNRRPLPPPSQHREMVHFQYLHEWVLTRMEWNYCIKCLVNSIFAWIAIGILKNIFFMNRLLPSQSLLPNYETSKYLVRSFMRVLSKIIKMKQLTH